MTPLPYRAVTLAISLLVPAPLAGQASANDTVPEVRTAASVHRTLRPNLATITLQLDAVDRTPARAGARVARRADSVRLALESLGIPRDSLLTGSRWYWWGGRIEPVPHAECKPMPDPRQGCRTVVDTTYRARESIEVRMRDIAKVGPVIDLALGFRITDLSPVRFSATDTRAAYEDALREATAQARGQAEILAVAAGGRLGRVLSISTQPDYWGRGGGLDEIVVTGTLDARPVGTEITAPSLTITATVYGRWRFERSP